LEIAVLFFAVVGTHFVATAIQYRTGLLFLVFFYAIYPKFFSLGLSSQGFALSGQRAMLYILLGFFILRMLWGSSEVQKGFVLARQYKSIMLPLVVSFLARIGGNIVTVRVDLGSIASMVNEAVVSIFIVMLILIYVVDKRNIQLVMILIVSSLLINELVAVYEFVAQKSILPTDIDLQYETGGQDDKLLAGRPRDGVYRSMGLFDNPLKLVGFLTLVLPLAIGLASRKRGLLSEYISMLVVVLAFPVAFFTGSRTAIGITAMILVWYLYIWLGKGLHRYGRAFLWICLGGVVLVALYSIAGYIEAVLFSKEYSRSTFARGLQFVRVPIALIDSPVFGFGFARNITDLMDVGNVDSFFLKTALEGGIVALGASLWAIIATMKILQEVAVRSASKDLSLMANALRVSLAFLFISGLVLNLSDINFYIYVNIGLAIALHHFVGREPSES